MMLLPALHRRIQIPVMLVVWHMTVPLWADSAEYETLPVASAADILPEALLRGDFHEVNDAVISDGYLNYYRIQSDYGDFEAQSTLMLRVRVREIAALATLDTVSKSGVFIKAAANAGVGQLRTIQQFATRPISTVVGIPAGIGRLFRRYKRQADDGIDTAKTLVAGDANGATNPDDDATGATSAISDTATVIAEGYFGVSGSERRWHRELGTDPYTSNVTLQKAVKSVAWADRLGRFGIKSIGIPKIPGVSIIGDVNDAVWSNDPYELQDLNRARLVDAGADKTLIEAFFEESTLSPTQQTLLIAAVADLEGAERRASIIQHSLNARSEIEARFFVESAVLLAWYHHNRTPIASVAIELTIPAGIRPDGSIVVLLAADRIYWNETIAAAAQRLTSLNPGRARELWLTGDVSARCHAELRGLGWEITENLTIIDGSDSTESPE
jgi:hypothetical protein